MKVYILVEHESYYDSDWSKVVDVFKSKKDAERVVEINPHRLFEIIERTIVEQTIM